MKSLATAAAFAAIAAAALPMAAQAQDLGPTTFYGSAGYSHADLDDVKLGAITGRVGARFGQYLGVEGEAGFGVKDDTVRVGATNVDVELKNSFAVYGVGFLPVAPNADLYARVGYGTTEIKASAPGASASADGDSWNYGVGGQYFLDDKNGVRADYTRYDFRDGDGDADVWSVGYVRKF
ncbi:porin family protein [Phenylobacterium sp.]|uniref:porin family protein n=1 Tax=Phenylobacterium sp. TaxID=1871053 RepID=UPI002FC5A775